MEKVQVFPLLLTGDLWSSKLMVSVSSHKNSLFYLLYPELFEPCTRRGVLAFNSHADALKNLVECNFCFVIPFWCQCNILNINVYFWHGIWNLSAVLPPEAMRLVVTVSLHSVLVCVISVVLAFHRNKGYICSHFFYSQHRKQFKAKNGIT